MKERRYLKKSVLLCGESSGTLFMRQFRIVKKTGEEGNAVRYEACHEDGSRGTLTEFCPPEADGTESKDLSERAVRDFLAPYEMLLAIRQGGEDRDLEAFIPDFEIFRGCDTEGKAAGAGYVWLPERKLETFAAICGRIHKHPGKNPEHRLVLVLKAVESLTRCIASLHRAGMLHLNIHPAGFGFLRRGDETLTQTVSMIGIDSVRPACGNPKGAAGTEGFREPEAETKEAEERTDLYAIGATLFSALIVTEEAEAGGYLYKDAYYDRLREMVDQSGLIRASESNAHPRLRNVLVTILQRCLCERSGRYESCEDLLEDLDTALFYALPSEFANRVRAGEKWILADAEEALERDKNKNVGLAIQYHLYEHPLYECVPDAEKTIHVLVIGFGSYGQKFLDVCLQIGQIRGKDLRVTVVSDDLIDRDIYLADRPALTDFFDVEGSVTDGSDSYGTISFEARRLERDDVAADSRVMQELLRERFDSRCPHYIFVALGEDRANLTAAQACRKASEDLGARCAVSYICEEEVRGDAGEAFFYPVSARTDRNVSPLHAEIERMAFNTHLIWEKNLNVDYRHVRSEFLNKYNHDSSVSSVLSLKYKLFSMGIDLDRVGFREAARLYAEAIGDPGNQVLKNELIWIEHRRWVAEKVCLGWRGIENLKECAGGVTKDVRAKRHVCIVRSRPDRKLAEAFTADGSYELWDKGSEQDLDQLDDLDRMSVELHRMFFRKALTARKTNILSGNSIAALRTLIEGNKKATVAFQEWYSCLKEIWSGDGGKVRLYKGYKTAFLEAAKGLSGGRGRAVREQVRAFESVFYPILASMEYRDWKQDDVAFIENIPFILTYTEKACLAIPFATEENAEVFENVSAATVVNPARILYLYFIEQARDAEDLLEAVPYVVEYMEKKRLRAIVEFVIALSGSIPDSVKENTEEEIRKIGGKRIWQVKWLVPEGEETAEGVLENYLKRREQGRAFFALEKNRTGTSRQLQGAKTYRAFASYEFDSAAMTFRSLSGCEMLTYITKSPYITVTDMAAFRLSTSESSNQPEFFADYKAFWNQYTKKTGLWKRLCNLLGNYAAEHDRIAGFRKKVPREKNDPQEYVYILPFACSRSAEKILRFLRKQEIAEKNSKVAGHTTDSCKIRIVDRCSYRDVYDRLFSNIYALMDPDAIRLYLDPKSHEVHVVFDSLEVKEVEFPAAWMQDTALLMGFFWMKGYIINLKITNDGKMSFTYGTRRIKELLTTAGKMLEVYTYHKAMETGGFDDVVSSFEIDWEGTEVTNEFDCLLTKGFRTLFVECKAREEIDQEFYYKLAVLAEQFGINATAVLIADTKEKEFYDSTPLNIIQRKRGRMMDVITVWKPEEINDIGNTLLKIIEGKYTPS